MKKKKNQNSVSIKTLFVSLGVIFLIAIFIRIANVKSLKLATREKARLIEQTKVLQSEIDDLLIEKQKLTAHDRIEKIAKEKLGLVPNLSVNEKIIINKKELDYIKRIVNEKYE